MSALHLGKQSIIFDNHPVILSSGAVGGKKEAEGPLRDYFDHTSADTAMGMDSWEKAERAMMEQAFQTALKKSNLQTADIQALFAGDLLNQCISSSFAMRDTGIPFFGLYGACSTMAESICLAAMMVNGRYAKIAGAMSSSHFASAERQYRFPLGYGGQRTPTSQWTVTGAGCILLGPEGGGPYVNGATIGAIVDHGIKDANNMGAAMAPAAYETIKSHFTDFGLSPSDYDLILTGDLGAVGKEILMDLFQRDGIGIGGVYNDCGTMVYDLCRQDVHAGGSGCGCGTVVLCGYILRQLALGKLKHILFCGTGALLSPLSTQQGETIPAVCHAVSIGAERR